MTITPIDSVVTAVAWGGVTAAGIMAGALLGIFAHLTHGAIARSMSVGAGLLLAAASVELAGLPNRVAVGFNPQPPRHTACGSAPGGHESYRAVAG
jgi:hypothetical protein